MERCFTALISTNDKSMEESDLASYHRPTKAMT
jgi:hypothetical protein